MKNHSISDRELRRAAEQVGESLLSQLPPPSACDHEFSERFEEKMAPILNAEKKDGILSQFTPFRRSHG